MSLLTHMSERTSPTAWKNQMPFNVHPFFLSSRNSTLITSLSLELGKVKPKKEKHAHQPHLPPLPQAQPHPTSETPRSKLSFCDCHLPQEQRYHPDRRQRNSPLSKRNPFSPTTSMKPLDRATSILRRNPEPTRMRGVLSPRWNSRTGDTPPSTRPATTTTYSNSTKKRILRWWQSCATMAPD